MSCIGFIQTFLNSQYFILVNKGLNYMQLYIKGYFAGEEQEEVKAKRIFACGHRHQNSICKVAPDVMRLKRRIKLLFALFIFRQLEWRTGSTPLPLGIHLFSFHSHQNSCCFCIHFIFILLPMQWKKLLIKNQRRKVLFKQIQWSWYRRGGAGSWKWKRENSWARKRCELMKQACVVLKF